MKMKPVTVRKAWSDSDVIELLDLYTFFYRCQTTSVPYTKAAAVRAIAANQQRSKGSIECKLMNVSAVRQIMGLDWVQGYKPLSNVNKALIDQVKSYYS